MPSIQAMYAHLQQTAWKHLSTTTLGNLTAEQYGKIEAAYAAQIRAENGEAEAPTQTTEETGPTSTEPPTENIQGGSVETQTPPTETVQSDVQGNAGADGSSAAEPAPVEHNHDFGGSLAEEASHNHQAVESEQKQGNVGDAV